MNDTLPLTLSAFFLIYGISGICITHMYCAKILFQTIADISVKMWGSLPIKPAGCNYHLVTNRYAYNVTSAIGRIHIMFAIPIVFILTYVFTIIIMGAPLGLPMFVYKKFFPTKI